MRWAVSESLRQAQSDHPDPEVAPQPDLALLDVRLQREYLRDAVIDWARHFDTNTDPFRQHQNNPPSSLEDVVRAIFRKVGDRERHEGLFKRSK